MYKERGKEWERDEVGRIRESGEEGVGRLWKMEWERERRKRDWEKEIMEVGRGRKSEGKEREKEGREKQGERVKDQEKIK